MIEITLAEIVGRIERAGRIWIVTHRRPDGDAVGSAFGLQFAIEASFPEKQITAICADEIPQRLSFLAPTSEFSTCKPFDGCDLCISVDIASRKLLGDLEEAMGDVVDIKIDHHESGDDFAPRAYVDPHAAAAGEIVLSLIELFPEIKDEGKARQAYHALYGAIAADTGGFRYSNTTPETHRMAAKLIEKGASHAEICRNLFECKTKTALAAEAFAMANVSYRCGGRISYVKIHTKQISDQHAHTKKYYAKNTLESSPEHVEKFLHTHRSFSQSIC